MQRSVLSVAFVKDFRKEQGMFYTTFNCCIGQVGGFLHCMRVIGLKHVTGNAETLLQSLLSLKGRIPHSL